MPGHFLSFSVRELPTVRPRRAVSGRQTAFENVELDSDLVRGLEELCYREGVTLCASLLAAWQALLSRFSRQNHFVVWTSIPQWNCCQLDVLSPLENRLRGRIDLSDNPTFCECMRRVQNVTCGVSPHRDLPIESLPHELQSEQDLSHCCDFQVMFSFREAASAVSQVGESSLSELALDAGRDAVDLSLSVEESLPGFQATLEFNTDLFDVATAIRLLGNYRVLLAGIVANPARRIGELPMLTDAERHQVLVEWNHTTTHELPVQCVHQLFEDQSDKTPDAVAVLCKNRQLTYRELNRRANRLAHHLIELGVGPESLVGVCVDRSPEMVVALLGILKAGGAYVPLDSAYPVGRLQFLLEDSQPTVVLTQKSLQTKLPNHTARVICIDAEDISTQSTVNPLPRAAAHNLAYVIYTSGSTGAPKGVAIEHRNTVTFIKWAQSVFTAEEMSGVLASTSICFDLSVFELFVTLSSGGRLILVENAFDLQNLSPQANVKLINTVPCVIAELLHLNAVPKSVVTINLAGELLSTDIVNAIYRQTDANRVYDLYGPTEDTTYSTYTQRLPDEPATIGRPIANTQAYVLDSQQQPVPIGVPGELYLGGDGLARGYLNRPELTRERFIPNQFSDWAGARLYRTGDLARWRADGNLECLGRIDHQIKIRGFRVELGEIEAHRQQHPQVRHAVVSLREYNSGDQRLVAYIVPAKQTVMPADDELRSFLKERLPEYMIPAAVVTMQALPLTPNGKVDRKALPLPQPGNRGRSSGFVPPRDALEERMSTLWANVLRMNQVGIHDNFCELGGNSLLIAHLIVQIHSEMHCELSMREIFESPTIAKLSVLVRARQSVSPSVASPPVPTAIFRGLTAASLEARPESLESPTSRKTAAPRRQRHPEDYLEAIRTGDMNAVPIVCVGDMRFNAPILDRMPSNVPVYLLKLDGCHVWPPEYITLSEQIALYVQSLTVQVQRRKALLIGFSYGGFLAYCLAAEMLKHNWLETRLLLFEPDFPIRFQRVWPRLQAKYRSIRSRISSSWKSLRSQNGPVVAHQYRSARIAEISDPEAVWNMMVGHFRYLTDSARLDSLRQRIVLFGSQDYHSRVGMCWEKINSHGVNRVVFLGTDDHRACFREPFVTQWLTVLESSHNELSDFQS